MFDGEECVVAAEDSVEIFQSHHVGYHAYEAEGEDEHNGQLCLLVHLDVPEHEDGDSGEHEVNSAGQC